MTASVWEHKENEENTSCRQVFSTPLECPRMSGVFCHFNTQLTLLHLFYDQYGGNAVKNNKIYFSMFYLTNKEAA